MKLEPRNRKRTNHALVAAVLSTLALAACGTDDLPDGALALPSGGNGGTEVIGTIRGNIGQRPGEWHAIRMGSGSDAATTASYFAPLANMMSYTIQGHAERRFAIENSLSIELSYMGDQLVGSEATYFHDEGLLPHYTSDGESLTVEITALRTVDDLLEIEGTARGKLFHVASLTSGVDPADAMPIDVTFRATLYPQSP